MKIFLLHRIHSDIRSSCSILASTSALLFFIFHSPAAIFPDNPETKLPAHSTAKNAVPYKKIGVPVLSYHSVYSDKTAEKLEDPFVIGKTAFKAQIEFLKKNKYKSISLQEFYDFLNGKKYFYPPFKPILITFDDGWKNFYTNAYPVLNQNHYAAVLFIYPSATGYSEFLNWKELQKIKRSGHEIEGHGFSHEFLHNMSKEEQLGEFKNIQNSIRTKLKHDVKWIAYPYGVFNHHSQEALVKSGYLGAFTVFSGENLPGQNLFSINRYLVIRKDSMQDFEKKLSIRSLLIEDLNPAQGSVLKKSDTITVKLKGTYLKNQLNVFIGGKFINRNKKVKFTYSEKTGQIKINIPYRNKSEFIVVNITAFQKGIEKEISLLYLSEVSK
ncbi:MAG: polysaccharide deacetylase family protein [Spirochaetia bacterium]|nr:polysaccharide deacetylase family protein [Spirochaetia bacterium]